VVGSGGLTNLASITISGNGDQSIGPKLAYTYGSNPPAGVLNNYGTIIQASDATLAVARSSTFNNLAGALYDLQGDVGIVGSSEYNSPFWYSYGGTINNAGLFRKSAGSGTSSIDSLVTFNNTGTVEVDSGTLTISGSLAQLSGGQLTGGTWIVRASSTLNISTGSNITTNAASVILNGSGSTFAKINSLNNNTGIFSVLGGRSFSTAGALANSGTITVSAGSAMTVTGAYSPTANSITCVDGTLTLSGTTTIWGRLTGTGTVNGSLTIADALAPGDSPGTLRVGNTTMAAGATYEWELGATTADKVAVTGNLTLTDGWKLNLLDAGGTPAVGSKYDLFTYTTTFSGSIAGDIIASPAAWPTARTFQDDPAKKVYVQFGLLGDTNDDFVVDAADYIALKWNFGLGSGATQAQGDLNKDGAVNWADLQIMMTSFGTGIGEAAITPEPATLGLLAIGVLAIIRRRRK
jgi:hypothetical protein